MSNELLTKTQLEAWNNSFEISELRKDRERLDWLMSMVGWASTREDIDRMMGNEDDDIQNTTT